MINQITLIEAAEQFAANYEGDTRAGIKTDVLNAFYVGTKFIAQQPAFEDSQ